MLPKILIVDDDPSMRRIMSRMLSSDCEVLEAATLREAAELFEKHRPRLVFLDVLLPDGEGTSLIRRFAGPECAVVMLTSVEDIESAQRALAEGASEYLTKPIKLEQLRQAAARRLGPARGNPLPWRRS